MVKLGKEMQVNQNDLRRMASGCAIRLQSTSIQSTRIWYMTSVLALQIRHSGEVISLICHLYNFV